MKRSTLTILGLLAAAGVTGAQITVNGNLAVKAGQDNGALYSLSGCKLIDGNKYPATGAGLQHAINDAAAAAGWGVCIPAGTTVNVDTTNVGPITISTFAMEVVGLGEGSAIAFTGTGNLFNVSAGDFQARNLLIQSHATTNRTSACVFYAASGGNYYAENLKIIGAATINNGDIFCGTVPGGGAPDISHVTVPNSGIGAPIWNSLVRTKGSSSVNINDTAIDRLYTGNIGCADACLVADTATGGWKVSNSLILNYINSGAPIAINLRNSASSTKPQNIFFTNTFAEAGSGGTVLRVDDGHLVNFLNGYLMGGQTAIALNGGLDIDISHNQIGASQQNLVKISASASNVSVSQNHLVPNGFAANNAYDGVLVQANANGWQFIGNQWEYESAGHLPRYCLNILNGTSTDFRVVGNNFSSCNAGTAVLNNQATGLNQVIWANTGNPGELIKSATSNLTLQAPLMRNNPLSSPLAPTISSGFGGTSPCIGGTSSGSTCTGSANGTAAFVINVGSGTMTSTGVLTMPAAANGWNCYATDISNPGANNTKESATAATTVTLTNYNNSGVATAWSARDILAVSCSAR
jgi:hypothetical protein